MEVSHGCSVYSMVLREQMPLFWELLDKKNKYYGTTIKCFINQNDMPYNYTSSSHRAWDTNFKINNICNSVGVGVVGLLTVLVIHNILAKLRRYLHKYIFVKYQDRSILTNKKTIGLELLINIF